MMRAHLQRFAERRRRGRLPRGHVLPARPAPEPPPAEPEQREREAAGGEDVATYTCTCGFHWEAPVSTTIACPHCGAGQAW